MKRTVGRTFEFIDLKNDSNVACILQVHKLLLGRYVVPCIRMPKFNIRGYFLLIEHVQKLSYSRYSLPSPLWAMTEFGSAERESNQEEEDSGDDVPRLPPMHVMYIYPPRAPIIIYLSPPIFYLLSNRAWHK